MATPGTIVSMARASEPAMDFIFMSPWALLFLSFPAGRDNMDVGWATTASSLPTTSPAPPGRWWWARFALPTLRLCAPTSPCSRRSDRKSGERLSSAMRDQALDEHAAFLELGDR